MPHRRRGRTKKKINTTRVYKKGPRGEYPEKGRRHGVLFLFFFIRILLSCPATAKQVFDFIFYRIALRTYYCIVHRHRVNWLTRVLRQDRLSATPRKGTRDTTVGSRGSRGCVPRTGIL